MVGIAEEPNVMNIEAMEGVLTGDGFDVWIEVDGEQAPQYVVESQETEAGTQISCWIASTSGKVWFKSYPNPCTSCLLTLEGHLRHSPFKSIK